MKLPFTDKFLWALYNFFESTDEALALPEIFRLKTMKDVLSPGRDFWDILEKKKRKKQFAQFINYLKRKGYVRINNLEGKKGILLTSFGKAKVLKVKVFIEAEAGLKKRKDGKWIMVIFDIPEKKKRHREELRKILYALGFQKLQKSAWVSPYDVLGKLEGAISGYNLDYCLRTFLIEEIEI